MSAHEIARSTVQIKPSPDQELNRLIFGINYPWTVFEGRANYGCDFGRNIWNSHTGVSAHVAEVRADFDAMAGTGLEVVRWFVFTDGRGGVAWNPAGQCSWTG